ncbi:hypothetical protein IIC65_01355, partial [Candidatus Sumerlaeota bacterium]|nr:hypothetical protein [Candidatus Sumerlaeota bacterium]
MDTLSSQSIQWEETLKALRQEIDEESFSAWVEPIRFDRYDDGRLTLIVPSVFFRNWVASNYQEQIERCFG